MPCSSSSSSKNWKDTNAVLSESNDTFDETERRRIESRGKIDKFIIIYCSVTYDSQLECVF